MSVLPIVQRELLIAARSRRVFRVRMGVALGATALGYLTVMVWTTGGGRAGGDGLFGFLTSVFWLVCFLSGVFLTADCISREKREGTLGLLFLTDLKGVDVILGKLMSTSLMTVVMVIGALPVLALCVLMGGVTGGEFVRTSLALLLTMLLSLSVGVFVSTFQRDSGQSGAVTFGLLLTAAIAPVVLGGLLDLWPGQFLELLSGVRFLSPAFLISRAGVQTSAVGQFTAAAVTQLALSIALLSLASVFVRYTWRDRPLAQAAVGTGVRSVFRLRRDPLLDQNPILWLLGVNRRHGLALAATMVLLLASLWWLFPRARPEMLQVLPMLNAYVLPYLLALAIVTTAAEFFVRLRQQGAFEFLLSTPLSDADILRGQWLALRHRFLPAAVVLIALIWLCPEPYGIPPAIEDFAGTPHGEILARIYLTFRSVLLWLAAGWTGMHFGLNTRRPQFAGLLAMIVGVGIPWFLWCLPEVLITAVLINVGRESLRTKIRSTITRRLEAGQPV